MKGGACSCGDTECASPGKHPILNSWQQPSMDADADANWWRMLTPGETNPVDWEPRANIGILTGEPSGVFVVDVDVTSTDGFATLEHLESEHPGEPIPATLMVRTGSGGRHYFFVQPKTGVGNSKPWGAAAGIDIRGTRGMVVAPPSVSGYGRYEFLQDITAISQVAKAPSWITEALRKHTDRQQGEPVGDIRILPDPLLASYVQSALNGEASAVRHAPDGNRNIQLNNSALSLGSLGAHGLLFEEEARTALESAALAAGLLPSEIRETFSSGWRAGLEKPRDLSQVGELRDHEWPVLPWDEFGLGDRLVNRKGSVVRWVESWQSWMLCLNGCWQRCSDASIEMLAQWMIRALYEEEKEFYSDESPEDGVPSQREKFKAWWKAQRNRAKIVNTIRIARDHPSIRAVDTSFDDHAFLLGVANGVVDLTTGKLKPHNPDLMLTKQCPVSYNPRLLDDPMAAAPLWQAFLDRVQPDLEMRDYLQRITGYSITGSVEEQVMFLHRGNAANGKSTFHDAMSYVLGPYSQATPVETLMAKRSDGQVPNDVARMIGKRYLLASEAKEGKKLDWPLLKQLIGGDRVAARYMRAEFFEFSMTGKIHLTANQLPPVPGNDAAVWRRLLRVEWDEFIPEEERDGTMPERLRAEATAILAWAIQGAVRWRQRKIDPPQRIRDLMESYRQEEDQIAMFLDMDLERVPPVSAGKRPVGQSSTEIYAMYQFRAKLLGWEVWTQRKVSDELKKKHFHYESANGWRGFTDLKVRAGLGHEM
jgi:putative DNA primase/helicase